MVIYLAMHVATKVQMCKSIDLSFIFYLPDELFSFKQVAANRYLHSQLYAIIYLYSQLYAN